MSRAYTLTAYKMAIIALSLTWLQVLQLCPCLHDAHLNPDAKTELCPPRFSQKYIRTYLESQMLLPSEKEMDPILGNGYLCACLLSRTCSWKAAAIFVSQWNEHRHCRQKCHGLATAAFLLLTPLQKQILRKEYRQQMKAALGGLLGCWHKLQNSIMSFLCFIVLSALSLVYRSLRMNILLFRVEWPGSIPKPIDWEANDVSV